MTQSVREVPAPSVPRPRCAAACIPASNTVCVGPSLPFVGPAEGSLLSVEPWPFQRGRWHGAGGSGGNQHSAGGHRARLQLLTGICDQYLLITSSGITSAVMQRGSYRPHIAHGHNRPWKSMVRAGLAPGIMVRAPLCLLGPHRTGRHISARVWPPGRRHCLDRDKQVGQGTGTSWVSGEG